MTTEEQKAKELIEKFMPLVESFSEQQRIENAKKCAIIAVDEVFFQITKISIDLSLFGYFPYTHSIFCTEVKTEIENYQP